MESAERKVVAKLVEMAWRALTQRERARARALLAELDVKPPRVTVPGCEYCGEPLHTIAGGRIPKYCSDAHRQAAYRDRKAS
jgi:hypothetical protein